MQPKRCGLLGSGEIGPERIEGGDVVVVGEPIVDKVVVVKHSDLCVPEVFVDCGFARDGAAIPFGGFTVVTEQRSEASHVPLVLVEQTVEANRRVVIGRPVEGAEAKAGIEARLAHGTIAMIIGSRQTVSIDVRVCADL